MLFTHRTLKLVVPNWTLTNLAPDEKFSESPGHIKRCFEKLSLSRLQLLFQCFVCWPASYSPLLILATGAQHGTHHLPYWDFQTFSSFSLSFSSILCCVWFVHLCQLCHQLGTDSCTLCAKIGARFQASHLLWCQLQSQRLPLLLHHCPGSLMTVICFMIRLLGIQMPFLNLQKQPPVSLGIFYSISPVINYS